MTAYLVNKTVKEDRVHYKGEILVDPFDERTTGILLDRGYLTIVPDNYQGAKAEPPQPAQGAPELVVESTEGTEGEAATANPPEEPPTAGSSPEPVEATEGDLPSTDELPKTIDLSEIEAVEANPDSDDKAATPEA